MKILILCDMFPPAFGPRMGYLCKYLKRAGWEPVVITEYIDDQTFTFLKGDVPVTYVRYYHSHLPHFLKKVEWIWVLILDFLFHYKDRKIQKAAEKLLKEGGYEGILCSSYRAFPVYAAQKAAEKFHLPLVVDLRDIIEQYAADEYIAHALHTGIFRLDQLIVAIFRKRLLADRNNALKAADRVTTVSPWHVEQLKAYNPHTELIYNGYDPELFFPERYRTECFTITYTGRVISLATRDPHLLFEAVALLKTEQRITAQTFRLQWFVDPASQKLLKDAAARYTIDDLMDFHAYIPASQIPEVLNKSSILLQLANKSDQKGPKGFMTTKLFEAMAVKKPLLCVRSDESFLEEAILKTRSGLAARTVEETRDFILKHYLFWQENGYTEMAADTQAIESFSRKEQAEQFMRIFIRLNNNKQHGPVS